MKDEEIRSAAIEFAKRNKNKIAKELTDPAIYAPDITPISVFMAGSPGAGKTEFSKSLIEILETYEEHRVIRIDGDEIRPLIPGYQGNNSHLFQGVVSLIVERMHDYALKQKQSFVLDGTFARYEKAVANIKRSLDKSRFVYIFYVYQLAKVAWKFTQAREKAEGRNIPKLAFIEQFIGARETVNHIAKDFGNKIIIFLVKKDFQKNSVEYIVRLKNNELIDDYVQNRYTKDELEKKI